MSAPIIIMKQKIKINNMRIDDNNIIYDMSSHKVKHIRFISSIKDGVIIAKFPDYKNTLTFGKHWLNVHYGLNTTSVRTPGFLRHHIGEYIEIFQEKEFPEEFELFRIKPIDFWPKTMYSGGKNRIEAMVPYFSRSGCFVLPKKYIANNGGITIYGSCVSFDRVNDPLIKNGVIFARLIKGKDQAAKSYKFHVYNDGLKTRKITTMIEMLAKHGKELRYFQYQKDVYDDVYEYNVMGFREVSL